MIVLNNKTRSLFLEFIHFSNVESVVSNAKSVVSNVKSAVVSNVKSAVSNAQRSIECRECRSIKCKECSIECKECRIECKECSIECSIECTNLLGLKSIFERVVDKTWEINQGVWREPRKRRETSCENHKPNRVMFSCELK